MPRTAGGVGFPSNRSWPPPGWHNCVCISAERWKSPKKKTPAIMLTWQTDDAEHTFEAPVWVTVPAIKQVNAVAVRVCGLPKDTEVPDSDEDALHFLARHIMGNAKGKLAQVQIVESEEEFMDQNDQSPTFGQMRTVTRSQVPFAGYKKLEAKAATGLTAAQDKSLDPIGGDDDLPF